MWTVVVWTVVVWTVVVWTVVVWIVVVWIIVVGAAVRMIRRRAVGQIVVLIIGSRRVVRTIVSTIRALTGGVEGSFWSPRIVPW